MLKNKKIIVFAIVLLIAFTVATAVFVSTSAQKTETVTTTTAPTSASSEHTDAHSETASTAAEEAAQNTEPMDITESHVQTTSKPQVETTLKVVATTSAAPTTTKPVTTTSAAAETTTMPSITTTKPATRSILEANDISGKYQQTAFEKAFFDRINIERTSRGIPTLIWNDNLHALTGIRSKEIIKKWDHERPNGKKPSSLLDENNISRSAFGENLACGTYMEEKYIDSLVEALMASEGHKANILSTQYKYSALSASVDSDGIVYIAQWFYTP